MQSTGQHIGGVRHIAVTSAARMVRTRLYRWLGGWFAGGASVMSKASADRRGFQFGMRTLFVATFAVATFVVVSRWLSFPIFVLIVGSMPAPILSAAAICRRQLRRPPWVVAILVAWLAFYTVSIGPVAGLAMWLRLEQSPRVHACFNGFYAPLIVLCARTPLAESFDSYCDFWQHAGLRLRR
jgi:hypothetical protein